MPKVLWFSRHTMTPDQEKALEFIYGDIVVNQVDKTISSAYEVKDEVDDADVICIVAPIGIQEQFLKIAGNKPVLTAKSDRIIIPDENGGESKIEFRFRQWDRLLKVEVLTEPLVTIDDIRKE